MTGATITALDVAAATNGNGRDRELVALDGGEWPELYASQLPPFPVDAFPLSISAFIKSVAEETQTPDDLAACTVLGVLGAAGMGKAQVDCGPWREHLNQYLITPMPSGERKSSVLRECVEPLKGIERERREVAAPEVREQRRRREVLEHRVKELTRTIAKSNDPLVQQESEGELTQADTELAEIGDPVVPRLLADDATPEALGGLLARHGRIAVLAAESAFVDNLCGRYSEGKSNLHLVCSAYTGEPSVIDRNSRDPEELERPLVSIVLTPQPHVLENLTSNQTARAQGLVARFAYAIPESRLGHRKITVRTMPPAVRAGWDAVVRRVFEAGESADKTDKTLVRGGSVSSVSTPQALITLSPEASGLLDDLRAELEPRLAEGGDLEPIADWVARHAGRIARIAGVLHLVKHPVEEPISEETMRSALRIGEYLLAHGLAALSGPDVSARRALRWLRKQGRSTINLRDLQRGPLGGRGTAEQAADLAEALERAGALRMVPAVHVGPGRPPSPSYEVHPDLRREALTEPTES